jgi:hypothetical protein
MKKDINTNISASTQSVVITPEDATIINAMIKSYSKTNNLELEVAPKKFYYNDWERVIAHYINISDDNPICLTSLDISVDLSNGKFYRISCYNSEDIDTIISNATSWPHSEYLKYLFSIKQVTDKYSIMIKDKGQADYLDIAEYDIRIKLTEEKEIDDHQINYKGTERVLYRYKERYTFVFTDYVIDITIVKSSSNASLLFDPVSTQNRYEIELEIKNKKINYDNFISYLSEFLKVIQDTEIIITASEKRAVVEKYRKALSIREERPKTLATRNTISMEIQHILKFIPNKYAITDKADGERCFICLFGSNTYLISKNMRIKKININNNATDTTVIIMDGELVDNKMFLVFDILYQNEIDYRTDDQYNLTTRINALNKIIDKNFNNLIKYAEFNQQDYQIDKIKEFHSKEMKKYWENFNKCLKKHSDSGKLFITRKLYYIPYGIDKSEVFYYADIVWKFASQFDNYPYSLDGIIYTPLNLPYMITASPKNFDIVPLEYKWKPPNQNSIDFYIVSEKDDSGSDLIIYDTNNGNDSYKIYNLFVGIIKNNNDEIPIQFKIDGIPQKSYVYLKDDEARDIESSILTDKTVVEFIYDDTIDTDEDFNRWIPIRTRHDKTESVKKNKKMYGNNLSIATRIWNSIIHPVSEEVIQTLADSLTIDRELNRLNSTINTKNDSYYSKRTNLGRGVRAMHNWIKSTMIHNYCSDSVVLDIGCGRGGDLEKIFGANIKQYVGTDIDYNGLYKIKDSANNRYLKMKRHTNKIPEAVFIQADSKSLFDVKSQQKEIKNMTEKNKLLIAKYLSGDIKYDLINCQFTLHYYLSNSTTWSNFCTNVDNLLNKSGYVLITCFDGDIIFNKLSNKKNYSGNYTDNNGNKKLLFDIAKVFDNKQDKSVGLGIDVFNSLISEDGKYIREYLVFSDHLVDSFKKIGLDLVESDTFQNLYDLYKNYFVKTECDNKNFNLIKNFYRSILENDTNDIEFDAEKINRDYSTDINIEWFKMSILNRYYIFRKKGVPDFDKPSRIVGINNKINFDTILNNYFINNDLFLDKDISYPTSKEVYNKIKRMYNVDPNVYFIRHTILDNDGGNYKFKKNKYKFMKINESDTNDSVIIYRSPDNIFYPLYFKKPINRYKYIGKTIPQHLFATDKISSDLDFMIKLTNLQQ